MTTQKIEFEYTARNESAGSRAWQEGRSAIDSYNRELTETNTKARQAADAMSAFGNKGRDAFAGMNERQKALTQGLDRLRAGNQQAAREAHAHRMNVARRADVAFNMHAQQHAASFATSASRARRAADRLYAQDFSSGEDVFGMLRRPDDHPERRLTTGSRFRGKSPKRGMDFDLSGFAGTARGMMGGLGLTVSGGMVAHKIMEVNQEMIEKADSAAEAYDTLSRSLNIQAGLTGAAAQEARQRILSIALDAAADKNFAFGLSTQMVSSGFSAQQATGGALKEMLRGINAMPAPGGQQVDPVALAEAATSYMTSQNMDKTGENLRAVLAGVQQLYKSTNFQLADFSELAGQADTMRGKMTMGEQFGAFSVLRDVGKSAEEATTALRNIAIRAQTVAGSSEKTSALESLGLKPEDIDMVGESFQDVLNRLAKAMDGIDPAKVTTALEKVFGERTLAGLLRLVEDREKVKERTDAIGDQTQYEADATQMSTGIAAAKRRQKMEAENWAAQHSVNDEVLRAELRQKALEGGASNFSAWGRDTAAWALRGLGVERDTAMGIAFDSFGGEGQLENAKQTLGDKGVNLTPRMQVANPKAASKTMYDRLHMGRILGFTPLGLLAPKENSEPDFIDAPLVDPERTEDEARRAKHRNTRDEALKLQPNYKSLPRPGAKTSAPAPAVADVGGSVEMKNSRLERGTEQQVTLLVQIATGISELNERLDRPGGGREPRRATPPWNPRQPPPLPAVVSLSASEVG